MESLSQDNQELLEYLHNLSQEDQDQILQLPLEYQESIRKFIVEDFYEKNGFLPVWDYYPLSYILWRPQQRFQSNTDIGV